MPAIDVMPAWLAKLDADSQLRSALDGGRIYAFGANRTVLVPSVEWLASGPGYTELLEEVRVQFDVFAKGWAKAWRIESRIRALSHGDVWQTVGSTRCLIQYAGARSIPFPSDPGVTHRALEFTLETVRPELAY